jgi:hypothetical protein
MMTMMLTIGLEPAEQAKVEGLDNPIATAFLQAGRLDRIFCQGRVASGCRYLDFRGPAGLAASVPADQFMAASNDAAVTMVAAAICQAS